jgi:hypothetical protein
VGRAPGGCGFRLGDISGSTAIAPMVVLQVCRAGHTRCTKVCPPCARAPPETERDERTHGSSAPGTRPPAPPHRWRRCARARGAPGSAALPLRDGRGRPRDTPARSPRCAGPCTGKVGGPPAPAARGRPGTRSTAAAPHGRCCPPACCCHGRPVRRRRPKARCCVARRGPRLLLPRRRPNPTVRRRAPRRPHQARRHQRRHRPTRRPWIRRGGCADGSSWDRGGGAGAG